MDGVQSFQQRSSDFDGARGNRVIIINRREPHLHWVTATASDRIGALDSCCRCCRRWSPANTWRRLFSAGCSCRGPQRSEKSASKSRGPRRKSSDVSGVSTTTTTAQATSDGESASGSQALALLNNAPFDFGPFPSNEWKTSKYTLCNFLPKNLFEQFRRLANFYFLVGAIIQIVIPFSPVGPATSLIPLVFVVSTTAIKQAYEDYLRHKLDNEVNRRTCYLLKEDNSLVRTCSRDIRVGDIVCVKNNEEVPCDMVLLAASGPGDRCYITTANLDGETSLKSRSCFQIRQQIGPIHKINETLLVLECEKPNATLYEFNGFLRAPKDEAAYERLVKDLLHPDGAAAASQASVASTGNSSVASSLRLRSKRFAIVSTIFRRLKQTQLRSRLGKHLTSEHTRHIGADRLIESFNEHTEIALDISNLLLRASRLRNTSLIYGLAVYTGEDTRLAHNSQVKPNKLCSLEGRVNVYLLIAFVMLIAMTLISALKHHWYYDNPHKPHSFLQQFTAHFVLYNYLVPISLYVTLEFVKFLGTRSVLEDKKLQAVAWTNTSVNADEQPTGQTASAPAGASQAAAHAPAPATGCGPPPVRTSLSVGGSRQGQRTKVGPQCNSSDLNEDLGQVEVLFSDKTGTLTENKMHFTACSIGGRLMRAISGELYEQPEGLCQLPGLNVAHKLAKATANRYALIASELAQMHGPRSVPRSMSSVSRSSKSSLERIAKLPPQQRPFDHRLVPQLRDLRPVQTLEQHQLVAEFFLCLCLCCTISLNEDTPLDECLREGRLEQLDYQSASPDEESLITAAAQFGVIICKSSERECFIAIRRPQAVSQAASGSSSRSSLPSTVAEGAPGARHSSSPTEHRQAKPTGSSSTSDEHTASASVAGPKSPKSKSPDKHQESGHKFEILRDTKHSTDKYIVRKFERRLTFEFNSMRKRMSVLCRDCDTGSNLLVTKGSESVLDCIGVELLAAAAAGTRPHPVDAILSHFEAFSKSGLRTMLVARRLVDNREYEQLAAAMHEVRLVANHDSRELRLNTLHRQVESGMALIGATAVEDCLQEGVPEAIAELKEAGIKVWLLTGDKVETAISVAYLCKLLDRNMNLLQLVRQQNSTSCGELLRSFASNIKTALLYGIEDQPDPELAALAQRESISKRPKGPAMTKHQTKSPILSKELVSIGSNKTLTVNVSEHDRPRFALVADGRSLHYAMKYARDELEFVCNNCVCVLGCRLSPLQKAEVVDMIKNGESEPITAAIGDGANDVSMIQEAHVGIGISGKEGRQAVNSSDFAINRFHMLNRLLFVHGHLFYHRTANLIHYFFYKNVLFTVPQFLYSFHNVSTASSLYHPSMLIAYNMLFTSFPILLYGLFEVNISEQLLESFPRLYQNNKHNAKMRYFFFFAWILMGIIQATIAFYFLYFIWGTDDPFKNSSNRTRLLGFSLILFSAIVLVATIKLYFISKNRSYKFDLASVLSCALLPLAFYILNLFDLGNLFADNSLYGQFSILVQSPVYFLTIMSATISVIIPDMIVYVIERIIYYRRLNSIIHD